MGKKERLFVPVTARAFSWFKNSDKSFELRREYGRFKREYLTKGRRVEIRRGYSGESIWGRIGMVVAGETLGETLRRVDYSEVIPDAQTFNEAMEVAESFVGSQGPFVLFEIVQSGDVS